MACIMLPAREIQTGQTLQRKFSKRAGKSTKVNHVTSKQYKQMNPAAADRPAYSILDNYMMRLADGYQMADWKDALDVYMAELK